MAFLHIMKKTIGSVPKGIFSKNKETTEDKQVQKQQDVLQ